MASDPGELFLSRAEMNRQLALQQSVAFHSGSPRNITAQNIIAYAVEFEKYLNGEDIDLSK